MAKISEAELRERLDDTLQKATTDIVVVTRPGGNVVLMPEAEFAAWRATASLLSDQRNAEALRRGLHEAAANGHPGSDLPRG